MVRRAAVRSARHRRSDYGVRRLSPERSRLEALRAAGKRGLADVLARIEARPDDAELQALLDEAWSRQDGIAIGFTGPPGVGKSTLIGALSTRFRKAGRSVAVLAVDPSSRVSGGALLGDRVRISADGSDAGLYIRSLAARDRLGGLTELATPFTVLFRSLFDLVLIETVGVGQSETDVADLADVVVLCAQPGSGDSIQFMKVSQQDDVSVQGLAERLMAWPSVPGSRRDAQAKVWLKSVLTLEYGRQGWGVLSDSQKQIHQSPFATARSCAAILRQRLQGA